MAGSARVLLVVPANNTTMEGELRALLPAAGEIGVARVRRPPRTLRIEDIPAYGEATIDAVEHFLDTRWDLAVYGCTAAGFLAGPAGNAAIAGKIAARTAAPVVSTAEAMIEVLEHEGIASTTVVTPYLAAVNDGLTRYLQVSDIRVERLDSFFCETTDALGRITQAEVEAKALATVTPDSRSLFIACSQLPTLDIVAPLRRRLGIHVWSSISATAWSAARRLSEKRGGMKMKSSVKRQP